MKPRTFLLGFGFAACAGLQAQTLPPPVSVLLPSYEKAARNYALLKKEAGDAEASTLPQVEELRALKAQAPGWFRDWSLRRKLSQTQERLDDLSRQRAELESARQDLFLQLSALEEELRSSLEKELSSQRRDPAAVEKIRGWLEYKRRWDRELEDLGSSEARPFDLVEVPKQAPTRQIMADQKKALEARGIQLEAWADMLASDLRLWKRLGAGNFVPQKNATARIAELEGLSRHVAALIRKNEAQRLANGAQKK